MLCAATAALLTEPGPFDDLIPKREVLGSGPHTLVIIDREAITRIDYPSGSRCQRAKDAIRLQMTPPPAPPGMA